MPSSLLIDVLDLLLPTDCAGCGRPREGAGTLTLCGGCASALPAWPWPLATTPEGLRSAWAWADYQGPVGAAIRRGKYRPDEQAVADLSAGLAAAAVGRLPDVDVVVPVPQMASTTLRRGFSPALVLGDAVAVGLGRPLVRALARREGARQAGMEPDQRAANVAGAFRARRPLPGPRVLLVDDVVTTGATASACARELLCNGARVVHLLAACRAH